jgi:hypothetical protein
VRDRESAATVLDGPPQAGEPGGGEVLIPRAPLFECLMFTTRSTQALERGIFTDEIVCEPLPDLGPELLDLYHPCRLTYQALALLEEHQ